MTDQTQTTDSSLLNFRPSFVEGQDQQNADNLADYGKMVQQQIDKMQQQREGWREYLQKLYEEDNKQDDLHRDLKRRVLIGEAEALANPTFHRWMKSREQHGVGSDKIDAWYTIDSLLPHTPYLCTIPCPRNLSDKGWELIEDTVDDLFGTEKVENFTIEWWPLLQHVMEDQLRVEQQGEIIVEEEGALEKLIRRKESETCFSCSSKKGDLRSVFAKNPKTLQRALIETPCFLIGDQSTTARLSSPFSSPLVVYVVRGTLIACEPYYSDSHVKFPSRLAPKMSSGNTQQGVSSANCEALSLLRSWIEEDVILESLPERSFAAVVMMTAFSSSVATFSILNLAPLDAVGSNNFAWSDLLGLIVNAQSKRRDGDFDLQQDDGEQEDDLEKERQRLLKLKQKREATPKVDVMFRGSWIKVDPTDNNSVIQIKKAQEEKQKKQQQEVEMMISATTKVPEKKTQQVGDTESFWTNGKVLALAATAACVASASIGITLGMKLAAGNKK
jgi:hypothetical protein